MSKAPSMPMYWDAYLADTTHLTTEEHGAYMLLLAAMWRRNGWVPDNDKDNARILGLSIARWKRTKERLSSFLLFENDSISQQKLLETWQKTQENIAKNKLNGAKGGRPKSNENRTLAKPNGYVSDNPNETIPKPSPKPKEESSRTLSKYPDDFEAFWKAWKGGGDKAPASVAWKKLSAEDRKLAASVAVAWFEAWRKAAPDATAIHASTYLNKRRFDGFEPPSASRQISIAGKTVVTNADPLWPALVARKRRETGKGVNAESWAFDDAWVEEARSAPPPSTEDLERGRHMQGLLSAVSGNA